MSTFGAFEPSQENIAGFKKQSYDFQNFPIVSFQKNNSADATEITIYIEGDGYAYVTKSRPSSDPTPKNPIGLYLAIEDTGNNVVYLGRPCQYASPMDFENKCDRKYWTTHRYASDVINAYHDVLNQLKTQNSNADFHLVGFSGGANIAGLLAAQRDDIQSIRTVAGNVDNDYFTRHHKVSDMPYSLNMADYAETLSAVPQVHFVAEKDRFVPIDIYQSYKAKLPHHRCVQMRVVDGTRHLSGWMAQWPSLRSIKPQCQ